MPKRNKPTTLPSTFPRTAAVQQTLIAWFRQHGRDLPFRHTSDPYAILVSEVMLQQTQVDRMLPKYRAFLEAFPTFAALAAAPLAEVLRLWSGLGYNQRAVRLQQIARTITLDHQGVPPQTLEGWLALPGIGPYTAGAVSCFALRLPTVAVDTNIRRVLTRIFIGDLSPLATLTQQATTAYALAQSVLPASGEDAYAWNQALMDLGATICQSRQPACERCPLSALCVTYEQMQAHTLFPSGAVLQELMARRIAEEGGTYQTAKPPARAVFKHSRRYYRGRIVATLGTSDGMDLAALGMIVKDGYVASDEAWLREIIDDLVRDGLARWTDATRMTVALPL